MTTEIARFMVGLERRWDEHVDALVVRGDVDGALAAMTAAPSVSHLPAGTGATGRAEVARFYREMVLPAGFAFKRRARVVDRFRLADELTVSFLHDRELPWLLPGVAATGRDVSVGAVVIVEFERGAIDAVRMHWDLATLRSQLG